MLSFVIRSPKGDKTCTIHQLQLMLSFLAVKHTHVQLILDYITREQVLVDQQSMELETFLSHLQELLSRLRYSNPITDLEIAWDIVNREESVCILLGGTSGCGKSTLASLLAHRIGITTVLSTDHVRSLLRSFDPDKKSSVLWASSYHAGEHLHDHLPSSADAIIAGYEAQSHLLFDSLNQMISGFRERKESLVIEGVGLSINVIRKLARKHPNCIPLIVYISNEQKHTERFAIRAKYMTVAPRANKYIRYFDNIRRIQDHLCREADEWMIPKVDNTNVDRSLAILHMTVLHVLARMRLTHQTHTPDPVTHKLSIVFEEYAKVHRATWSSKQMLRQIRQNALYIRTGTLHKEQGSSGIDQASTWLSSLHLTCHERWKGAVRSWNSRS